MKRIIKLVTLLTALVLTVLAIAQADAQTPTQVDTLAKNASEYGAVYVLTIVAAVFGAATFFLYKEKKKVLLEKTEVINQKDKIEQLLNDKIIDLIKEHHKETTELKDEQITKLSFMSQEQTNATRQLTTEVKNIATNLTNIIAKLLQESTAKTI